MSDTMKGQPFDVLLKWILKEYEEKQSIFGIHRSLFYTPQANPIFATRNLFGSSMETPIGPAAGPHTQLAQNIIAAWLSGARFIELKTVQIMDELEIPRPCIDMEDEGYNVEWSQELKLSQSISEYIKAWALIPIMTRLLGWEGKTALGTIFNMSVGYNLEGIQSPVMTQFMDRMADASAEIDQIRSILKKRFPQFADVEIPNRLTNNVTLSTMHGCPPDEIERIARYVLEERGLHTTVKLNPTLLGKEAVLKILNLDLGYSEISIPDTVFEHDLSYDRALRLIQALKQSAVKKGLSFGVKLSNTLPVSNHKGNMPGGEMYMSGRALYPITMNLFNKLAHEFNGDLKVSYSAGADAMNVTTILSCGALPVTVASDLLKPGGYSRMLQYLENLERSMQERGVSSLEELAKDKLSTLEWAAAEALIDPRYKKEYHPYALPKVKSGLDLFDCVTAPCTEPCAVHQDIPGYAWLVSRGEFDQALAVVLARNPLPGVTGYVCTHLCQTRCTRNNYDEPVAIRALKRAVTENGQVKLPVKQKGGYKVAIVGSGPSGLSAGTFLALNGVQVTIFEAKDVPGGMMRLIPSFRLPTEIIEEDIARIASLGVEIKTSHPVNLPPEELLKEGFDAVYVAVGFQKDMPLDVEGGDGQGVFAALDLLERVRRGEQVKLGKKALVIGGGDTAMDAARVARRLTGSPATIVYRRTHHEMPASEEELEGAFEEGTLLEELVSPGRVILKEGRVIGLECVRNRLGEPDASGRRRPIPIAGSEFVMEADAIIAAIGQKPDLYFMEKSGLSRHKNGSIAADAATGQAGIDRVYAGGDVVEGPESIIAACGDGRKAAEAICKALGINFEHLDPQPVSLSEAEILQVKQTRVKKSLQVKPLMMPVEERSGFKLIESTFTVESARTEAQRCLQCSTICDKCVEVCPNRANYAISVTPVSWELPRLAMRDGTLMVSGKETYRIRQTRQIIHVDDFCNECGNCASFCVHEGKPYLEKPRLFLKEGDFLAEDSNAFFVTQSEKGWVIQHRRNQATARLSLDSAAGELTYDNTILRVVISTGNFQVQSMQSLRSFIGEVSLAEAAEMYAVLQGIIESMPFALVA